MEKIEGIWHKSERLAKSGFDGVGISFWRLIHHFEAYDGDKFSRLLFATTLNPVEAAGKLDDLIGCLFGICPADVFLACKWGSKILWC